MKSQKGISSQTNSLQTICKFVWFADFFLWLLVASLGQRSFGRSQLRLVVERRVFADWVLLGQQGHTANPNAKPNCSDHREAQGLMLLFPKNTNDVPPNFWRWPLQKFLVDFCAQNIRQRKFFMPNLKPNLFSLGPHSDISFFTKIQNFCLVSKVWKWALFVQWIASDATTDRAAPLWQNAAAVV